MLNKQIEAKVERAFSKAVPDVWEGVLSECGCQQKGQVIFMEQRKKHKWIARIAGVAAALALVAVGVFGFRTYEAEYKVESTVSLDVNPSIEIRANRGERVLKVLALNEEGSRVIGSMKLEGSDLEVAVNALIGSMLRNGYISDVANSILVSVDHADPEKSAALQAKLASEIDALLKTDTFSGAVLSQSVHVDKDLASLAEQHGITAGKAQLIRRIVEQNPRYTFEQLVPLTVNELNLISEAGGTKLNEVVSTGTASAKSYIGEDAVKTVVLARAGLAESELKKYEVEWELDSHKHGLVYEVEFEDADYEYEYLVDAADGQILKQEKEPVARPHPADFIEPQAAKTAALTHAGLQEEEIRGYRYELENKNDRSVYEIEFYSNGYEYDYDVDAYTAEVLYHSKEAEPEMEHTEDREPVTRPAPAELIGKQAAKDAALIHAGVKESEVRGLQWELDEEDGRWVYQVEFRIGQTEYEYEIDAQNGGVLTAQKEKAD